MRSASPRLPVPLSPRLQLTGGRGDGETGGGEREERAGRLTGFGCDCACVVAVADNADVSGAELVQAPQDLAGGDGFFRREALDQGPGDAQANGLVPVVLDDNLQSRSVGCHLDPRVLALDLTGLSGRAYRGGVQNVLRGQFSVAPVGPEVPPELAERDERGQARDQRDRDMEGDVAAPRARVALLDLDLEAAEVFQLAGGPAPDGDGDRHQDDDEEAQDNGADFFHVWSLSL